MNHFSQKCNCGMMQERRRRRKIHGFNKKNSFTLLRYAHSLLHFTQLLWYTFYVICYLSLYFFVSHFSYLFSVNLFFSLQNLFFPMVVHFLFPIFFILPRCVFVSILCKYTPFSLLELKLLIIILKCVILLVFVFSFKSLFVQNL